MFLAMGVGAFGAGIFHLYTHAFFKALLFLGSGAVIHALHGEQDIRNMGGLRKDLPITYWTFLIGALAIAGVFPLSGFFSKDEILFETFVEGHTMLWMIGALTSLLTATYMFRLVFLTFHGERRHDAPAAARRTDMRQRLAPTRDSRFARTRGSCIARTWIGLAPSRRAAGDGARADRAGDRLGRGRLHRRSARARRTQPACTPGSSRRLPRRVAARRGAAAEAGRGRRGRGRCSGGHAALELTLMGVSLTIAVARHRHRLRSSG